MTAIEAAADERTVVYQLEVELRTVSDKTHPEEQVAYLF